MWCICTSYFYFSLCACSRYVFFLQDHYRRLLLLLISFHHHLQSKDRLKFSISITHSSPSSFDLYIYPHDTKWNFLVSLSRHFYRKRLQIVSIMLTTYLDKYVMDIRCKGMFESTALIMSIFPANVRYFPFHSSNFLSIWSNIGAHSCLINLPHLSGRARCLMGKND